MPSSETRFKKPAKYAGHNVGPDYIDGEGATDAPLDFEVLLTTPPTGGTAMDRDDTPLTDGVQGFLDFEGPLFEKLHLPFVSPIAGIIEGKRMPWIDIDRDPELRESSFVLLAKFNSTGAHEFEVGELRQFIENLPDDEDSTVFEKFASMFETVAGDNASDLLAAAVKRTGGREAFTEALKSLYSKA
jgi:hypothetical protein